MDTLLHFLEDGAKLVYEHRDLLMFVSAAVATFFALAVLLLRLLALSAERWAKFFGWAFAVYAIQYIVQGFGGYLEAQAAESAKLTIHAVIQQLNLMGSVTNNLLLLAAAYDLLGRKPVVPRWAWRLAAITVFFGSTGDYILWSRIPDALFSAVCMFLVGYAIFINIDFKRRPVYAVIAICIGTLYSFLQIAYGLHPIIAVRNWSVIPEWLHALIPAGGAYAEVHFLDALAIGAALPLKFGLFFSAYFLLMRALVVVSSSDVERMMQNVIKGRSEYLSAEGIVRSIAESVAADVVELSFRLPGLRQPRIKTLRWARDARLNIDPGITPFPSGNDSMERRVLQTGNEVRYPDHNRNRRFAGILVLSSDPNSSIVAVPIRLYGAVIGCLKVEWNARSNFSATAVQHIRQLAVLVAPAVQSNRELAALDQFAYRFNRLQFEQLVESLEQSVGAITLVLHDVLSPLATYVEVETGFQSFRKLHCDDATFRKYLIEKTRESSSDSWAVLVDGMAATSNEIFESDLVLRIPGLFETEHPLGRFKVLVPPLSDDTTHPTLALNKLHRRAVATLFSDAFLDLVRECFNMLLKDLGIRFSQKETTNVAAWFRAVEETAIKAGLTWAVASHRDDNDLLGNPNAVEIVRGLSKHVTEYTKNVNIKLTKLYDSTSSTKSVLEIVLPIAKLRVWLGVSREGFGVELTYASPWMTFLEHFVDIADATVVRIMASIELQRIQTESAQYQGLATVAVTTGTLIHQVTNMVKGMQGPISTLVDAFTVGKLQCEGEIGRLIALMSKSAKQLLELISPITNITKLDTHRPCRVLEAAVHAKSLFDMPLRQREIELKIMVDPEIEIDLPFHVAGFALANLVTNAIDALNGKGTIEIHAEDAGDVVYCHVSDDGPGVPASIRDRIFELGITTKQGSGGWGLYLVYRSLGENRCRIDLTNPGPGGTRFTIRFPKAKEEERI